MTIRACLFSLLLVSACATSGNLSAKPVAVGAEWITLEPRPAIQGGRERFVLVESPEDGPVECNGDHGVNYLYKRGVRIEVEVMDRRGAWLRLRCAGYHWGDRVDPNRRRWFL